MSEIKDRQDAASDIDPIVAALADDSLAAAAVEGFDEAAELADLEAEPTEAAELPALETEAEWLAAADEAEGEPLPAQSDEALYPAIEASELEVDAEVGDEVQAELVGSADVVDAMQATLLQGTPGPVAKPLVSTAFENLPAAYADTIVELDAEADTSDDDAPLLDVDLEDGIASVFAALHAAREDNAPVEPLGDLEAADGVTFRLLGELDRLWHRAA